MPNGNTSSGTQSDPKTLVAILTYGRPTYLPRLLQAVQGQLGDLNPPADALVVDNDPAGTADAVAQDFSPDIKYVLHGAKGIAEGRNRILDESVGYDCVVLIDDDEVPDPQWLRRLVSTYQEHRPAAVAGPQFREYEVEPSEMVFAARAFDRPNYPTGTRMPAAATNNLLLDVAVTRELGLRFDPQFSVTGGSDTMFTRNLVRAGHEIVWCQEAGATEFVPASRLTMRWVWKRSMRSGMTWARTGLALEVTWPGRTRLLLVCVGKGVARVLAGSALASLGYLSRDWDRTGRGLRTQARGIGMVAGSVGLRYQEYRSAAAKQGAGAERSAQRGRRRVARVA